MSVSTQPLSEVTNRAKGALIKLISVIALRAYEDYFVIATLGIQVVAFSIMNSGYKTHQAGFVPSKTLKYQPHEVYLSFGKTKIPNKPVPARGIPRLDPGAKR